MYQKSHSIVLKKIYREIIDTIDKIEGKAISLM